MEDRVEELPNSSKRPKGSRIC